LIAIRQKLAAIFQGEHAEHLEHIRSILALPKTWRTPKTAASWTKHSAAHTV
jgi:hypothetical protein